MKNSLLFFGMLVIALQYAPLVKAQQNIATVGDVSISYEEFKKKYKEVVDQTVNPPTEAQFLEDLVRYEVGVQEAKRTKLDQDPIVQERIKQEIYKGLVEKAIGKSVDAIRVNEKEMQAYYKRNPEIRTSHILIQFKPEASDKERAEAKKRAGEILSEVKKSKRPFEELVKLYSDDSLSKENGGDVGWQNRMTIMPQYYEAALKLRDKGISQLVETRFGFHIIQRTGVRPYDKADKASIRTAVFNEKRKDVFNRYFADLKKKYKISVNSSLLKK